METNKRIMGVGCFAKPSTLARVLRKAMETYMMAPIESVEEFTRSLKFQNRGAQWVRYLISGQSGSARDDRDEWMRPGAVSGFFLGVEPRGLKLSIFTDRQRAGRRHLTVRLDEAAALRRKRLH